MTKRKNHSPEFKARVALEAIREEKTPAELSKKYGVHTTRISTWKRAAIRNTASAFAWRGADPAPAGTVEDESPLLGNKPSKAHQNDEFSL